MNHNEQMATPATAGVFSQEWLRLWQRGADFSPLDEDPKLDTLLPRLMSVKRVGPVAGGPVSGRTSQGAAPAGLVEASRHQRILQISADVYQTLASGVQRLAPARGCTGPAGAVPEAGEMVHVVIWPTRGQ